MALINNRPFWRTLPTELRDFIHFLRRYLKSRLYRWFKQFEVVKDVIVDVLHRQRGRYARPVLHLGTLGLVLIIIGFGPKIFASSEEEGQVENLRGIEQTGLYGGSFYTNQAEEVRQYRGGEIITHTVGEGETLSSIAERYGLSQETVMWENNLTLKSTLKPGQQLNILPVDGLRHKVARGETIYSIGKKYGLEGSEVQVMVDYPFNEFLNDETFEVATGQFVMVPGGVKQAVGQTTTVRRVAFTPDAGAVTALGSFVWPASGRLTQGYAFYHKAIDIANSGGGSILAADSGTVVSAGWLDGYGYGNRILIDHGNGFATLYAHLSAIQVSAGQRVNRGDVIGQMGSTGRSTGTHLHFEIRQSGSLINPLTFLR